MPLAGFRIEGSDAVSCSWEKTISSWKYESYKKPTAVLLRRSGGGGAYGGDIVIIPHWGARIGRYTKKKDQRATSVEVKKSHEFEI